MVFSKNLQQWYQIREKKIDQEGNLHQSEQHEQLQHQPAVRSNDNQRPDKKH
jgi:hypothetical protein